MFRCVLGVWNNKISRCYQDNLFIFLITSGWDDQTVLPNRTLLEQLALGDVTITRIDITYCQRLLVRTAKKKLKCSPYEDDVTQTRNIANAVRVSNLHCCVYLLHTSNLWCIGASQNKRTVSSTTTQLVLIMKNVLYLSQWSSRVAIRGSANRLYTGTMPCCGASRDKLRSILNDYREKK